MKRIFLSIIASLPLLALPPVVAFFPPSTAVVSIWYAVIVFSGCIIRNAKFEGVTVVLRNGCIMENCSISHALGDGVIADKTCSLIGNCSFENGGSGFRIIDS